MNSKDNQRPPVPAHQTGWAAAFKRELARHARAIAKADERAGVSADQLAAYDSAIDAMDFMSRAEIDQIMQSAARQVLRAMWPRFRRAAAAKRQALRQDKPAEPNSAGSQSIFKSE